MIDIHCHILPGLDDGPDQFETSVKMAEMAIADGISHIVATPHADDMYHFDFLAVRTRCNELQSHTGDRLILATGCDFHLSFENLERVKEDPSPYTLNQKDYLLVEFSNYAIPPNAKETLHSLHLMQLYPVITHPERNALITHNPEMLHGWLSMGCYVQVTAGSLLGRFGPGAQRFAEMLLDNDCIHFVASDAHNVSSRPPRLGEAYEVVAKRRGADVANALFWENPLAAFEGRSLPYVPEIPEEAARFKSGRRKRFFLF